MAGGLGTIGVDNGGGGDRQLEGWRIRWWGLGAKGPIVGVYKAPPVGSLKGPPSPQQEL